MGDSSPLVFHFYLIKIVILRCFNQRSHLQICPFLNNVRACGFARFWAQPGAMVLPGTRLARLPGGIPQGEATSMAGPWGGPGTRWGYLRRCLDFCYFPCRSGRKVRVVPRCPGVRGSGRCCPRVCLPFKSPGVRVGEELRGVLGFLRGGRGLWRHHRRSCVTRPARDAGDQANRVAAPHPDRVAGLIVWPEQARALETRPDRRRALSNRERRRNSSCSIRQRGIVLHALASARWMRGSRSCGRLLPLEQSTKVHTRQAEISVKSKLRASTDSYGSSHERERFNSCRDCSAS